MWVFYILLGFAVGSFLNVCIDRLPRGQSVVYPPSHCDSCRHSLAVWDLIPALSYVMLRGRCRYCGARIPSRIFVVEIATGIVFGFLWLWLGPGVQLAVATLYASVLIIVTFIDLEHGLILNKVIYPAILLSPITAVAYGLSGGARLDEAVVNTVLGGLMGFGLVVLPYLLSGVYYTMRGRLSGGQPKLQGAAENGGQEAPHIEGMGAGDVKLGAFLGVMTGFPNVLVGMFASFVLGGIIAAVLLATRLKGGKDPIPYGPILVLGAVIAFVWGQRILDWYLGRMF